jgi:hypothetical protein
MKRGLVGCLFVGGLVAIWSCSDDASTSKSPVTAADAAAGASSGSGSGSGSDAGGGLAGVECTHPGAGKSIGNDRCECATTRNVAGQWSAKRTCREGDACPTRNKDDQMVLTQEGTTVRADRGDTYSITGMLCGDVLVWTGGPKDGLNPECGQLRFTDDGHFVSDSCFVASGACQRTHGQGCPEQKGQCTGTGAKMPETAADVQKLICTSN